MRTLFLRLQPQVTPFALVAGVFRYPNLPMTQNPRALAESGLGDKPSPDVTTPVDHVMLIVNARQL